MNSMTKGEKQKFDNEPLFAARAGRLAAVVFGLVALAARRLGGIGFPGEKFFSRAKWISPNWFYHQFI